MTEAGAALVIASLAIWAIWSLTRSAWRTWRLWRWTHGRGDQMSSRWREAERGTRVVAHRRRAEWDVANDR